MSKSRLLMSRVLQVVSWLVVWTFAVEVMRTVGIALRPIAVNIEQTSFAKVSDSFFFSARSIRSFYPNLPWDALSFSVEVLTRLAIALPAAVLALLLFQLIRRHTKALSNGWRKRIQTTIAVIGLLACVWLPLINDVLDRDGLLRISLGIDRFDVELLAPVILNLSALLFVLSALIIGRIYWAPHPTLPPRHGFCSCGYDMSGARVADSAKITCSECGKSWVASELQPSSSRSKRSLAKSILLAWSVLIILLSPFSLALFAGIATSRLDPPIGRLEHKWRTSQPGAGNGASMWVRTGQTAEVRLKDHTVYLTPSVDPSRKLVPFPSTIGPLQPRWAITLHWRDDRGNAGTIPSSAWDDSNGYIGGPPEIRPTLGPSNLEVFSVFNQPGGATVVLQSSVPLTIIER
jgi:hypothetical protein